MMNEGESSPHSSSSSDISVSPNTGPVIQPSRNVNLQSTNKIKKARGAPKTSEIVIFATIMIGFAALMSWSTFRCFLDAHAGGIAAFIAITVMVLTAFYVIFARSQWIVMEDQLQQMIESRSQAERLIIETTKSAKAAKASADALENSERAWVMVNVYSRLGDSVPIYNRSGADGIHTQAMVTIVAKNHGRSPAWIVRHFQRFQSFDEIPRIPDFTQDLATPEFYSVPVTPNGGDYEKQCDLMYEGKRDIHRKDIVYGIVQYRDIFDRLRTTTYGYYLLGSSLERMVDFPEYNKNT